VITIDLNADLGAGPGIWRLGVDDALLDVITSANLPCGGVTADPSTMRRLSAAAAARRIVVGARVDYRDAAPCGRIEYNGSALRDDVIHQIAALDGFCRVAGTRVRYVKPHGILDGTASVDETQADALVNAVLDYDFTMPLLCRPGSVLATVAAQSGLTVVGEGFADRGYVPDGTPVPPSSSDAVVRDPEAVAERAWRMAVHGTVIAVDGSEVPCRIASIRVRGGSPDAVHLAHRVNAVLTAAGLRPRPFT
jgi:UPF0271 protein